MLASRRDQENRVHSHQVPTKQHPKTPGARYPKTPLKFGQNDENAPTAFAGKSGVGGAKVGGIEKTTVTKANRQAMVTPTVPQSRAPLGAKTTNAKARTGQASGVKNIVKDIEKTQLKPTAQKPKPKSSLQIEVKHDQEEAPEEDNEPEYAPPRPADLPYESDLLPPGGLSVEGLKGENLFQGFYEHFINPIDENGMSRRDKQFNDEMKAVMDKAMEKNEKDLAAFDWNPADKPESSKLLRKKPDTAEVAETKMAQKVRGATHMKQPSTITSRKAAAALSAPSGTQKKPISRPASATAKTRRPLSALMPGQRMTKQVPQKTKVSTGGPAAGGNGAGQVASRTTLGYNKGKSASSLVHTRAKSVSSSLSSRSTKTSVFRDDDSELTITPARARQLGLGLGNAGAPRPDFMSIFEQEEDDEDLPPLSGPSMSDDEDEFEIKFDF